MRPKKNPSSETRPPLRSGSNLLLHPDLPGGNESIAVSIERIEDGTIWLKGEIPTVEDGDHVTLEYRVVEKGRYLTNASVDVQSSDDISIKCAGEWRWVQDRDFVRISTHGIDVTLPASVEEGEVAKHRSSSGEGSHCEMLDMSAGGFRFETGNKFEVDREFICHFELPGQSCYVLPARVVRVQRNPHHKKLFWVGVEFRGIDEEHRSELIRWINREQIRRHRSAAGKD